MTMSHGMRDTSRSPSSRAEDVGACMLWPVCQKFCISLTVTKRHCHLLCMSSPQTYLLIRGRKGVQRYCKWAPPWLIFCQLNWSRGRMGRWDTKRFPGDNPRQGQSTAPSPRTCNTAAITAGGRLRTRRTGLPHHLFPEKRVRSEIQGSAVGKAVPPQALKKGLCSRSAFFFSPSGLNPLLERDNYLQGNRLSLLSASSPSPFAVGSFSSKTELSRHHGTAPGQENCEHRMLQGNMWWST